MPEPKLTATQYTDILAKLGYAQPGVPPIVMPATPEIPPIVQPMATPGTPAAMDATLLNVGAKLDAQKKAQADNMAAGGLPNGPAMNATPNAPAPLLGSLGGGGVSLAEATGQKPPSGVPSLLDLTGGPKPGTGGPPPGKVDLKSALAKAQPGLYEKMEAKGYIGGGPKSGGGAAPAGPPKSLVEKSYLPGQVKAFGDEEKLMTATGDLDKQAAELQAEAANRDRVFAQNVAEQNEIDQAADAAREEQRIFEAKQGAQALEDEAVKLSAEHIDPDHYWASKGVEGKIGGMIAVFLSGLGGGENQALSFFQRQVDQDIDSQKANLANKHQALAEKRSVYAIRKDIMGDERLADASARAAGWQQIGLTAQAHAAETSSEKEKINAQKLALMADGQVTKFKNEIQIGAEQIETQKIAMAKQAAAAASAAAANDMKAQNKEDRKNLWEIANNDVKVNGGEVKILPNGMPQIWRDGAPVSAMGSATGAKGGPVAIIDKFNEKGEPIYKMGAAPGSPADATKLKTATEAYAQMKTDIATLKALHDKSSFLDEGQSADDKAKATAIATRLKLNMKNMAGLGALSGPDMDLLEGLIPKNPLDKKLFGDPNKTKLDELEKGLDNSYAAAKVSGGQAPDSPLTLGKPQ